MARYIGSKCRLCRREQSKLFLKGLRCNTEKCSFNKRPTPPGAQRKTAPKKASYYSIQLREKQKVKRIYGMLERQFKRFFKIASRAKGVTGLKLIQLLESRLDNLVFRALFAYSRTQARQVVLHGFIFVNGKRVNIPSYNVKENDIIELRGNDKVKKNIKETIEINTKERSVPEWLYVDTDKLTIRVSRVPNKEDISIPINEQYIVELYSK